MIFGPIADVAREKLSREELDLFELASMFRTHHITHILIEKCFLHKCLSLGSQKVNQEMQEQTNGVQESFVFIPSSRSSTE